MKIRTDFVTNSSSSSYVIAVKKHNMTGEELEKYVKDYMTRLEPNIVNTIGYFNDEDDSEYIAEFRRDVEDFVWKIFSCQGPALNLDNWVIYMGHAYSDELNLGCLIYDGGLVDDPLLKMAGEEC